ncbi:hypothetical protein R3P38DRAFT_3222765 [Favolaschia claudopus]|uniref:Myb/SANT-like domain-containing protein n=1 Tax=Favolaschia claudopus TaxID=2862362 RepID=A0AAV9ZZQ8_9AGAR
MPDKSAANWTADPKDITNLLAFFHSVRSRIGDGGNWDKTVLKEAEVHMAGLGAPVKGGPKVWTAIRNKWKDLHKLHGHFVQIKQKTFVVGFNVDDDNREAWGNSSKPIRNSTMDEIVPLARPRALRLRCWRSPSEDNDDESQPSQPLTQSWSQTNYGDSQPPNDDEPPPSPTAGSQPPPPSQPASQPVAPAPSSSLKRASPDEVASPWSGKRTKVTGPESLMAEEDLESFLISVDEETDLHILFGRDTSAADAYITAVDPMKRIRIAKALLRAT